MSLGIVLVAIIPILAGCTVVAYKNGDRMTLKGFGAKKAAWPEGYSIEKDEPFSVPDIIPPTR